MKKYILFAIALLLTMGGYAQTKHFTKITVASWNIGHFAIGQYGDTKIDHNEFRFYKDAYRTFFNDINADILALIEYNPLMVNATDSRQAIEARDAILCNYINAQIGPKYSYNCNAIYSNGFCVVGTDTIMFSKMVQKRYYLVSKIIMDGDTVKVVSTHLDWDQGENGAAYRGLQIQEIIEAFKNDKYVIMCADWNTSKSSEYDPFTEAGYLMANHGYMGDLPTYPAGVAPRSILDNIITKGFAISNVSVVNNPLLSDHCLLKADLTKIP